MLLLFTDDAEKIELAISDNEDADSEDARWNDDVNPDGDIEELDEDEFDNDYCSSVEASLRRLLPLNSQVWLSSLHHLGGKAIATTTLNRSVSSSDE
ncbi:unnamed protein product [Trichobilharzia regenti]|nr:unnamed protein product [Trichobilharzia regenti]